MPPLCAPLGARRALRGQRVGQVLGCWGGPAWGARWHRQRGTRAAPPRRRGAGRARAARLCLAAGGAADGGAARGVPFRTPLRLGSGGTAGGHAPAEPRLFPRRARQRHFFRPARRPRARRAPVRGRGRAARPWRPHRPHVGRGARAGAARRPGAARAAEGVRRRGRGARARARRRRAALGRPRARGVCASAPSAPWQATSCVGAAPALALRGHTQQARCQQPRQAPLLTHPLCLLYLCAPLRAWWRRRSSAPSSTRRAWRRG